MAIVEGSLATIEEIFSAYTVLYGDGDLSVGLLHGYARGGGFYSKMCIQSEQRFDFLKELVSSVPDLQGDTDCPDTPMSAGIITPGGGGGHASSSFSSSSTASANAPSTAPANLQVRKLNISALCVFISWSTKTYTQV